MEKPVRRSRKKGNSEEEEHLRNWAASLLEEYPHCLECEEEEAAACLGEDMLEELQLANSVLLRESSRKSSRCIQSSRGARRTTLPGVVLEEAEDEQ